MYIKVRTIDGKQNIVITVSKKTTVAELKKLIKDSLNVESATQRLFYRGKQLEDVYTLFDYGVNINDVVQLMIKSIVPAVEDDKDKSESKENENASGSSEENGGSSIEEATSKYYKMGDQIDVLHPIHGAWFEGKIVSIVTRESCDDIDSDCETPDDLIYKVQLTDDLPGTESLDESLNNIRPQAIQRHDCSELKVGDKVLANYNIDRPQERGFWYDCSITQIGRTRREIYGTIYLGKGDSCIEKVKLPFCGDLMKIKSPQLLVDRKEDAPTNISRRESAPLCTSCCDRPKAKCKECGCNICGLKDYPDKQIMCDECDMAYHIRCLNPPLDAVPETAEWYCPFCKNDENEIVKAGESLKESKKKTKMASYKNNTTRDWGKGMACVGRTKECTIVPPNHYGSIPGIEVGTCWKFRLQVSEAGVHRPHVAGIHGRESDGAYSIVLSGGYEDDTDSGESFLYTGSGGRDLSGNKRTAEQSCDQTLTRMNKALAMNCNAPLSMTGAKAKDWKGGKPIRVVRNYKLGKLSKYAPEDGNRYDGIYKVVKYYPEKGKSGYVVWRYELRRDDPSPSPWSNKGKEFMKKHNLTMIYPEGYLEAMSSKDKEEKRNKRVLQETSSQQGVKRQKIESFSLENDVVTLIAEDKANSKLWSECQKSVKNGKQKFLEVVTDTFLCICCQEVVHEPVTTVCQHNFCLNCLKRSYQAEVYTCPCCRHDLGKSSEMMKNDPLSQVLLKLFPGYTVGR